MRRISALIASLVVSSVLVSALPTAALAVSPRTVQADVCPPASTVAWPTNGAVAASVNGDQARLRLTFMMSTAAITAAQCKTGPAGTLKVYFVVSQAGVSGTQYIMTTNLYRSPGVLAPPHTPVLPSNFEPGATRVNPFLLTAGTEYFIDVAWTKGAAQPSFQLYWSAYRGPSGEFERALCAARTSSTEGCFFAVQVHPVFASALAVTNTTYALPAA